MGACFEPLLAAYMNSRGQPKRKKGRQLYSAIKLRALFIAAAILAEQGRWSVLKNTTAATRRVTSLFNRWIAKAKAADIEPYRDTENMTRLFLRDISKKEFFTPLDYTLSLIGHLGDLDRQYCAQEDPDRAYMRFPIQHYNPLLADLLMVCALKHYADMTPGVLSRINKFVFEKTEDGQEITFGQKYSMLKNRQGYPRYTFTDDYHKTKRRKAYETPVELDTTHLDEFLERVASGEADWEEGSQVLDHGQALLSPISIPPQKAVTGTDINHRPDDLLVDQKYGESYQAILLSQDWQTFKQHFPIIEEMAKKNNSPPLRTGLMMRTIHFCSELLRLAQAYLDKKTATSNVQRHEKRQTQLAFLKAQLDLIKTREQVQVTTCTGVAAAAA